MALAVHEHPGCPATDGLQKVTGSKRPLSRRHCPPDSRTSRMAGISSSGGETVAKGAPAVMPDV